MIKGNLGVEKAVLAGLCRYGQNALYDIMDIVTVHSFTNESNQAIYKCIEKSLQDSSSIDATSVLASAETLGLSSVLTKNKTDIEYIRAIFNFPIKQENIRVHAKQLAKLEFIRKAQVVLHETNEKLDTLDGTESIDSIVQIPENAVFDLTNEINSRDNNNPQRLCLNSEERLKFLADNPIEMKGIPTPWGIFNDILGGGLREGVNLIGARPGQGKSSMAINVGWHVADTLNIPVLYVDTEMIQEEQENRMLAFLSGVKNREIETGKFGSDPIKRQAVFDANRKVGNSKFYHKWVGGKPFEEITSIMRRWIMSEVGFDSNGNTNPHLLIYDYFKLMDDNVLSKMAEHQAIGFQISYLSDFCKKYSTPCLSFVQVNRDGITKDTSDIISQSDRLLWLCVSCCVFKEKSHEEMIEDGKHNGNRKMFPLKVRYGEPMEFGNYLCMHFDGAISKITEKSTKFDLVNQQISENNGFETYDNDETDKVKVDMSDLQ